MSEREKSAGKCVALEVLEAPRVKTLKVEGKRRRRVVTVMNAMAMVMVMITRDCEDERENGARGPKEVVG